MMATRSTAAAQPADGVIQLDWLGAIHVHGEDAEQFLNAQLSNTVPATGESATTLAAWCDGKGRTRALFRVVRTSAHSFILIASNELVPNLLPTLRMFVLRADVEVSIPEDTALFGLYGDSVRSLTADKDLPSAPGHGHTLANTTVIRMAAPHARYLAIGDQDTHEQLKNEPRQDANAWQLDDIRAGRPSLCAATQNQFVPQMLNLHWLDGIDFHKGCYPGQEIVARLQFRGSLKRRVYRASVDGPAAPGATIDAGNTNAGTVLQSALTAEGNRELLAVIQTGVPEAALTIGDQPLQLLTLPYATDG